MTDFCFLRLSVCVFVCLFVCTLFAMFFSHFLSHAHTFFEIESSGQSHGKKRSERLLTSIKKLVYKYTIYEIIINQQLYRISANESEYYYGLT